MSDSEDIAELHAAAAQLTFVVTTGASCAWSVIATGIANYAVQPDMPFGLGLFFLLSLPCSVPLAWVAVILGRCVSLLRYARILSLLIFTGCVLWLICDTRETKLVTNLAWESGVFIEDPAHYVFTLFGLPPLVFGMFLFCFAVRRSNAPDAVP